MLPTCTSTLCLLWMESLRHGRGSSLTSRDLLHHFFYLTLLQWTHSVNTGCFDSLVGNGQLCSQYMQSSTDLWRCMHISDPKRIKKKEYGKGIYECKAPAHHLCFISFQSVYKSHHKPRKTAQLLCKQRAM